MQTYQRTKQHNVYDETVNEQLKSEHYRKLCQSRFANKFPKCFLLKLKQLDD